MTCCSGKTILADIRPNHAASPPTYRVLARLLREGGPRAEAARATNNAWLMLTASIY
jgi:hypothetical protein